MDLYEEIKALCVDAKEASFELSRKTTNERNSILLEIAKALRVGCSDILKANKVDLENARKNGISEAMLDRLMLNESRVEGLSLAIEHVVSLPDPIGKGNTFTRPNGLKIECTSVPLGVVAMIYEARPNVTPDAISLCIKSGNSVVLRGGKEAINTNKTIVAIVRSTLSSLGFNKNCVCLIENTTRESANALMEMRGYIDVLIPRGGKGLIQNVVANAKVPVIETGAGVCHLYVDKSADLDMALKVAVNAKCSRPSVCNAIECILVQESVASEFFPRFYDETRKYNLKFKGCADTCAILPQASLISDIDYDTEYDDYIINCKVVKDVYEAVEHIRKYSTGHSESIITENGRNADYFVNAIDSCALYVNASTRFTDGGEFGLGAEIGISTQKLHARGPMGLSALTTQKYIVKGDGHIR